MTNTGLLSEVVLILSKRGIAAARRRIILSSLYLGTGQHEQDLVHNTHVHTHTILYLCTTVIRPMKL